MRIKRKSDDTPCWPIRNMEPGTVFHPENDAHYIVTDAVLDANWQRCPMSSSASMRLCIRLIDGEAELFDLNDTYAIVDGAFVEGA